MSWLITPRQPAPAVIGEPFGGGFFAGYISHTADGNPTHALIVAPMATGATGTGYTLTNNIAWKTANSTSLGATSTFDGAANAAAIATAGIAAHPAAQFCTNLSIGGFTDWYLPAILELDIAYFNLKPATASNLTQWGINDYSVPKRAANFIQTRPEQTPVAMFNTSTQSFLIGNHWSSTQANETEAWLLRFLNGNRLTNSKTSAFLVRAFRRIAL